MKTISRLLASALILVFSFTAARAINPQKAYAYTPKDFGIEYIEDSVVTSDGYRINIWNLPGTEENGRSVLIACADAGNMGQWLGIGATLCFLGYDVWMFDYRGFGGSQDFATDRDMLYGFRGSPGTCRRPPGQTGGRAGILHGHHHGRGASAAIPRKEVAHPELRHGRVHLRSGGERQDSERGQ